MNNKNKIINKQSESSVTFELWVHVKQWVSTPDLENKKTYRKQHF